MSISIDDLPEKYQKLVIGQTKQTKRKNKYNARRIWYDGIAFDSQKESNFYFDLKMLHKIGAIDGFMYHGNMVCTTGRDAKSRATLYETDFVLLFPDGTYEIVDTKGVLTDTFKLKMKCLKEKYPRVKVKII